VRGTAVRWRMEYVKGGIADPRASARLHFGAPRVREAVLAYATLLSEHAHTHLPL
jgi:hypothetical protein